MTENYITSKIYCIKSKQTDKVYIGSTSRSLKERYKEHKHDYKRYNEKNFNYVSSFEIFKFDDVYIELIKEIYCNKQQLRELENEEINKNENSVNIMNAVPLNQECKRKYLTEYAAKYRKTDKYKEYNKLVLCDCGGKYHFKDKQKHIKTLKHQKN